jgi:hypothetical protein
MNYSKTLLAVATAVLSATAFAQPHSDYSDSSRFELASSASNWQPRLYLALDGGLATHDEVDIAAGKKAGVSLTLGYELTPAVSVEVSARDLGKRELVDVDSGLGLSWRSKAVSAAAVLRTGLTSSVQLTGKVGLASTWVDATAWADGDSAHERFRQTGPVFGVGLEGRLDRHFSWRANLDIYPDFAGSGTAMKTYSLGVAYRF